MKSGAHGGFQRDPKIEIFRGLFAPPSQDPPKATKMDAKLAQNGSKIEAKWGKHGIKMQPKSNEKLIKSYQNGCKMSSKWI